MGTFGKIAVGARGLVAVDEERQWGAPVPPKHLIDFTSESLVNEIGNLISDAIDRSRGVKKRVRGTSAIGGDINFENATEGYEVFYKHGLGDAITLWRTDGGVRTRTTQDHASGVTTLNVEDTTDFHAGGGNWALVVVYKGTDGLLYAEEVVYSAGGGGGTTFTVTATTNAFPQGAWVFQCNDGTDAFWDGVYTTYIEAAAELPAGLTVEAGRDIAHFIYSGMKVDVVENTFNAQEILTGTFSLAGKAEYVGGRLTSTLSAGVTSSTQFTLKDYTTSGSLGFEATDYWPVNGVPSTAGNDCTSDDTGGGYTGNIDRDYIIEITAAGATDSFRWSDDGGQTWTTVATMLAANTLSNGLEVNFVATTGHAVGEAWTFRATVQHIIGFNPAGGTIIIGTEHEITYDSYDASTGVFDLTDGQTIEIQHEADEPIGPQTTWQEGPYEASTVDPLTSFEAGVYIDGVWQEVLTASYTLNNNHNTDKFQLGDRFRAGLPEQRRTVEGTLNVEFDDLLLYDRYIRGTPGFLELRCIEDSTVIGTDGTTTNFDVYRQAHFLFPNIEFTGTTPNVEGQDMITHDMPFTALRDVANNMNEMAIILVSEVQPYYDNV